MQTQGIAKIPNAFARGTTDARVLVVDGFGVSLKVNRGHLVISDGIGPNRRERQLSKVDRTTRRIIILNASGIISFDAVKWCESVGISLVYTTDDGEPLLATRVTGEDARLRRAQAFAGSGGPNESVGLRIVKDLLTLKMQGQEANLRNLGHEKYASRVAASTAKLKAAKTVDLCRGWEGRGAKAYWEALVGTISVPWSDSDAEKVPAHWRTYVSRQSLTSGKSRGATDPINAMFNYCYRLAEIEAVLACHATGLDPTLGFLHLDKDARNSLALDLMELIRPEVDAFVLGLLGELGKPARKFSRFDFLEASDGACRITSPLTHELAEQTIRWAKTLAPTVERYAKTIATSAGGYVRVGKPTEDKGLMLDPDNPYISKPVPLSGEITVSRLIPDDVWERVSPMLPELPAKPRAGRKPVDFRSVLAGIVCVEVLGASWARIPRTLDVSRYTCKARLDEWRRDGVWDVVWEVLKHSDIE